MPIEDKDFYTRQAPRLLNEFDRMVKQVKGPVIARFGVDRSTKLFSGAREEYQRLLPQLPYVGGKQPLTQFVISSGWYLALYRVMQAEGEDIHTTGKLAYQLTCTYLQKVPGVVRQILGRMTFSPRYQRDLRRRSEASLADPYPRGYIASFIKGDGVTFDFGVDYHRCATLSFLREEGAAELAPYLCACDYYYSEKLNWGLCRTTTLAEGGEKCDFRYKRGGPTRIHSTVIDFSEVDIH